MIAKARSQFRQPVVRDLEVDRLANDGWIFGVARFPYAVTEDRNGCGAEAQIGRELLRAPRDIAGLRGLGYKRGPPSPGIALVT